MASRSVGGHADLMKEKKENKFLFVFNHAEEIVIVGMFAAMVVVIFIQVIMRYVFDNSLVWSEEFGKFMFIWITWLGISLGERYGEHIKITMLVDRLPFKIAQLCNILSEIIVIGICLVTFYYGVSLVGSQWGTHYTGIRISVSWGYLAVVIGCGLMMIRSVVGTVYSIRALITGKLPPAPPEDPSVELGKVEAIGGDDAASASDLTDSSHSNDDDTKGGEGK